MCTLMNHDLFVRLFFKQSDYLYCLTRSTPTQYPDLEPILIVLNAAYLVEKQ